MGLSVRGSKFHYLERSLFGVEQITKPDQIGAVAQVADGAALSSHFLCALLVPV